MSNKSFAPKLSLNLGRNRAAQEERAPEEFWGNIGLYAEYTDEDGNPAQQFISLNSGIALSSIPDMKKSQSPHWNAMCSAKDSLRDQLLEIAQGLEPGETHDVQIILQVRRVGERQEVSEKDNPFMVTLK